MPTARPGEAGGFDAEAACDAVRGAVEGRLPSFVEFDAERFNPVYVDDETLAAYDDVDHVLEHFDRIHGDVDLAEIDRFVEELFPIADRVEYLVTGLDAFTLVRFYVGEQGAFLAIDPDEPIEPVIAAIQAALDDE